MLDRGFEHNKDIPYILELEYVYLMWLKSESRHLLDSHLFPSATVASIFSMFIPKLLLSCGTEIVSYC